MQPPSLIVRSGPLEGQRFEVASRLVFGRAEANVLLDDEQVSRPHAVFDLVDGALQVEDLDSTNGTLVNENRIAKPTRLEPGDRIRIGRTTIQVEGRPQVEPVVPEQPAEDAAAAAAAAAVLTRAHAVPSAAPPPPQANPRPLEQVTAGVGPLARLKLTSSAKGRVFPSDALLIVQLIVAWEYLMSAINKIVLGNFPSGLGGELRGSLGDAYSWYRPVLRNIVIPNGAFFGYSIEIGELLIGLALAGSSILWLLRWETLRRGTRRLVLWSAVCSNLAGAGLLINLKFAHGATNPFFFPAGPFDEAVDLDTIFVLLQLTLAGVGIWLLSSLRGRRAVPDLNPAAAKVVIAGGGFAGLAVARKLEKLLPPDAAQITLVSADNFLLYTPLLPGVAAGALEPTSVVVPLREQLDRVGVLLGHVTGVDLEQRVLHVQSPALGAPRGRTAIGGLGRKLPYDHLIVALGSVSRKPPIPGLAERALGLKTLRDAFELRNRVLRTLELAESLTSDEERRAALTYVFVGAGYAGVEGIAELQDFVADVIDLYPMCAACRPRWVLLQAGERIMPETSPRLAEFAAKKLVGRGLEIRTNTKLTEVTPDRVMLSTGEEIHTHTVVWTAGVEPEPTIARLGLPLDEQRRIRTNIDLRVEGQERVWAAGDASAVPDPAAEQQRPCPPTAQHAVRQGYAIAVNIAAALGFGRAKPFGYKSRGSVVELGRRKAVAQLGPVHLWGFLAWAVSRSYHLMEIPGLRRKIRLSFGWGLNVFQGRDTSDLGRLGASVTNALAPVVPGGPPDPENPLVS
jgi:NADH:ubiquinone reductase (H+-translocating)